ncbi:CUGBP Elav-like family member 1, partial [Durusdinium trenchii]
MAECPPEQENEESRAALRFLKKCRKDMQLWKLLVSKPFVAKRLCDSLAAEVKSDQAFAAAVAAIAPSSHPKKVKRRNSEAPASLGSAWPPKSRRRLCYKQGPSGYWRIEGIGCLNVNLMAHILSFADLGSKLSGALRVAKGFHEVLQVGAAWDPLVVDQQHCRGMLHLLRAMSVFSALGESVQPAGRFPGGFFESSKVEIVLMDPEKPLRDLDSDTEEDEPRARRPLKILCPMREFGRG